VIRPSAAGSTYYQGGNITVEAGGTLNVTNVTLSFAQYVSVNGTPEQRLSHIYRFVDEGTVNFYHANLTTDVNVINAYAKLNFSVMGVLSARESTFAFPGWFYIDGSAAKVTLNASAITGNAAVVALGGLEPTPIWGDTLWAPTVTVLGGAHLTLFASTVAETYADPLSFLGYPRPLPLSSHGGMLTVAGLSSTLNTSNSPESLAQDWSYPNAGAVSGTVRVNYTDSNPATNTVATIAVSYGGSVYTVGGVTFLNDSSASLLAALPASLLSNITSRGMLQYLNYTGAFDTSPQILAEFTGGRRVRHQPPSEHDRPRVQPHRLGCRLGAHGRRQFHRHQLDERRRGPLPRDSAVSVGLEQAGLRGRGRRIPGERHLPEQHHERVQHLSDPGGLREPGVSLPLGAGEHHLHAGSSAAGSPAFDVLRVRFGPGEQRDRHDAQ
jgi:hypothetical protein